MTGPRDQLDLLPFGQLATRQWLLDRGLSRHALDNALKSGKLVPLTRGIVARPGLTVSWKAVTASLDRMLPNRVYVGGLSALDQAGLGHYVTSAQRVHLYSATPQPSWLPKLTLKVELVWHSTRRQWDQEALLASGSLREQTSEDRWSWWQASPEQAFLEVLADVPHEVSFEYADNLMQGMSALSPRRLHVLLRACHHVKIKRLFFFFADRYQYPWRNHLRPEDYDLGAGKRSVMPGGKLDKTYLITVPGSLHGSE